MQHGGSAAKCFECEKTSHHKHHVVPRVRGGTKTVWLCAACHGLAHEHVMPLPELIKAGIKKARDAGAPWGAKRQHDYDLIRELYSAGMSCPDIARKLKVKYVTVSAIVRRNQFKRK